MRLEGDRCDVFLFSSVAADLNIRRFMSETNATREQRGLHCMLFIKEPITIPIRADVFLETTVPKQGASCLYRTEEGE